MVMKIAGQRLPLLTPSVCAGSIAAGIGLAASLPHPAAKAGAYLAILGSLLTLCGIVSKEDLQWLKGLIYKK